MEERKIRPSRRLNQQFLLHLLALPILKTSTPSRYSLYLLHLLRGFYLQVYSLPRSPLGFVICYNCITGYIQVAHPAASAASISSNFDVSYYTLHKHDPDYVDLANWFYSEYLIVRGGLKSHRFDHLPTHPAYPLLLPEWRRRVLVFTAIFIPRRSLLNFEQEPLSFRSSISWGTCNHNHLNADPIACACLLPVAYYSVLASKPAFAFGFSSIVRSAHDGNPERVSRERGRTLLRRARQRQQ